MLSTDWTLYGFVFHAFLTLSLAILCWVNARNAASHSAACQVWVRKVAELRDPTTRIAELSSQMTELTDSYDALLKSHKKLRSRITMRDNRQKGLDASNGSDLSSERDKDTLRLAAKSRGLLK